MSAIRTKSLSPKGNFIGQRLKYEMKSRGISSAELAKQTDVKTSFIYDVISGKSSNPSTVKLARVAEGLGISLASLIAPEDRMENAPANKAQSSDYVIVPYLSMSDAPPQSGQPQCFLFSWISKTLGSNVDDVRVFTVGGDNMEPTLHHNDIILVDTAKNNPTQQGIYVLYDGYGLSVKRVERVMNTSSPRIRIVSDNPQYSIYESSPADAGIIGRVVWFSRGI